MSNNYEVPFNGKRGVNAADPVKDTDVATKAYVDGHVGTGDFKADGSVAMAGDLNLAKHKILNAPTPIAAGDLATKEYVDGKTGAPSGGGGGGTGDFMADGSVAMTGNLNAGTHKVVNVVDPTAAQDAATKAYVDGHVGTGDFKADGSVPMTGVLNAGSHKIANVTDPASAQDAATKAYVDAHAGIANPLTADLLAGGHNVTGATEFQASSGYVLENNYNGLFTDGAGGFVLQDSDGNQFLVGTLDQGLAVSQPLVLKNAPIANVSGNSYLSLALGTMGLHNGESSSPDADITLSSDNGLIYLAASAVDAGAVNIINLADPVNPQDAATMAYVLANAGSSADWSTHAATSDVDMGAAGYSITGATSYSTYSGTTFGQDFISSESDVSFFYLTPDANFGIYNGEPAGVGSDINLVSQNGNVILGNNTITGVNGTLPFSYGDGQAVDLISTISHARIWTGYVSGPRGSIEITPEFDSLPGNGLRIANYSVAGTDDLFFQMWPAASTGFAYFEGQGDQGFILNAGSDGVMIPLMFAINRSEIARFDTSGAFLVGATTDDGTGAAIQSANSISVVGNVYATGDFWSQGSQGQTEDVTVLVTALGATTTLHFVGGIYNGRD